MMSKEKSLEIKALCQTLSNAYDMYCATVSGPKNRGASQKEKIDHP